MFTSFRQINRDPEIPDGGAGSGGGAGEGAAAGSGAAPAQSTPARDYGRDIDTVRSQFGEFTKRFDSFHSDYQSKFGGGEKKPAGGSEPKLSDFPNTQDGVLQFMDARAKHIARQEYTGLQKEGEAKQAEQATKAKRSANIQAHVGRIPEAVARYKDFDQVVNNAAMALPENVLDDVLESNFSADLQYHLSKNAGDLYKIVNAYNQSERAGSRMLGALEFRFEQESAARKAALKKTRFNPTETVDGEAGGAGGEEAENEDIARSSFKLGKKK
jgi:hypothetical protein